MLHCYSRDCVVQFPKLKNVSQIPPEVAETLKSSLHKPWFAFTSKESDFEYILQESSHLVLQLIDAP